MANDSRSSLDLALRDAQAITTASDAEQVLDTIERMRFAMQQVRRQQRALEDAAIEWIQANGPLGDYYVGRNRRYQERDPGGVGVARALVDATGGDLIDFCNYLSSKPWKPGSVRSRLGEDRFAEVFETIEEDKLRLKRRRPDKL